MNTVVQILDSLADAARTERTDGQLLDLFVRLRDEEGFAAIVRRHGPMVRAVCCRVLRNTADADDAFQAAFLVLARKAATIGTRHRLAQWLYGVAYNTARKLREANARRAKRECPLAAVTEPPMAPTDTRDEWLAVLDDELSRLSERYREVIVLCDLEGLTRRGAAQALGCPEGTVAGRLARARQLLAARLTARGVVPVAAVLALLTERSGAAVPPPILASVIRAVRIDVPAHAAASGLISRRVADTTEGVLRAMLTSKFRAIAPVVICSGLALACCVGAFHFASARPVPEAREPRFPPGAKPVAENPAATEKAQKVLTVIPLKTLEPEAIAKPLAKSFTGKGVTVSVLVGEKGLLIYADQKATVEIEQVLHLMGEERPKRASVIPLQKGANAGEIARELAKKYPKATFVPVADEGVVLVYADHLTTEKAGEFEPAERRHGNAPAVPAEKTLSIHFDNVAWKDVLDWYATETGLTMITTVKPTGSVTIKPGRDRKFTMAEVTDLINETMAQQKFILVRRRMTFFIHPADEKIDPTHVPRIALEDLPKRGRTEIVQVLLPIKGMVVTDTQYELKKLLTPFGQMVPLDKTNAILIMDTVGNIDRIVRILQLLGHIGEPLPSKPEPALKTEPVLITYALTKLKAAEVAGQLQVAFPRMRIIPLTAQNQIMVLGTPDEQFRLVDALRELEDKPHGAPNDAKPDPRAVPPAVKKFPFRMKSAKWDEVFDTYAKLSGLTPVLNVKLTGTFTYEPPAGREFTLVEITDIINEALARLKVILIRRGKTFVVLLADEKLDGSYFARVTLSELADRGRTELVEVSITLKELNLKEEEAKSELRKLLSPFGEIAFAKGHVFVLRDTAGNVLRILSAFKAPGKRELPWLKTEPIIDPHKPRMIIDPEVPPRKREHPLSIDAPSADKK
ncbi:RNA polymerase sigma factor [Frigoriglobus tundricola]|uniref:ECF RNA polymerase sigma factor SigE n=1 Tax=Frigoriglobus tundricola TaxID=2774151 RepID=A0A6M5Z2D3_9BACT|nr:RNA polymerase sigma factor [Frigoriglobus tundricola]QJW99914.1 hypothetical protein FTUN_7537 [Frigoriglobus tundricola]